MITVVVPSRNEEKNIKQCLQALRGALPDARIIVVDRSEDRTPEIVEECGGELHSFGKPGKGAALMKGFELAEGTIVMTDADNSYPAEAIPKMLTLLESADVVIGSRYCKGGSSVGNSFIRGFLGKGYSLLSRIFLGVSDPQSGLKVFRKEVVERVGSINEQGFGWDTVFIARVKRKGLRVMEYPIVFHSKEEESNVGALGTTWSMWWNFVLVVLRVR